MRFQPCNVRALFAVAVLTGLSVPADAQDDDLFSFVPPGGRTILGELTEAELLDPDEITSADRTRSEWSGVLETTAGERLDPFQLQTLAAYLSNTMPAASKGGKLIETGKAFLPRDGRDLTMEYCQSCHIITVVITQARSREAWLGTMNKPSHVEIDTTTNERDEIADYLTINGGIPIDDVPEELRAGGATY